MNRWIALLGLAFGAISVSAEKLPNIVYVICDDLGYGEIQVLNPERGKVPTPHVDKLASEGMIFTDAHSGSSVCTPTRYGVMTGRHAWRTRLQEGVLTYNGSLIAEGRLTVPALLKKAGYRTAAIGKWHLGLTYTDEDGNPIKVKNSKLRIGPPVGSRVVGSPVTYGFDYFYGFSYARCMRSIIENDRIVMELELDQNLRVLADRAEQYIAEQAKTDEPFFLYVALGAPHSPVVPSKDWIGKSGMGEYCDFVMETDHTAGRIFQALADHGVADNTLVIFTSDNGCSAGPAKASKLIEAHGHYPSGHLRGYKAGGWEGGHRIPFIVRWPGKVKAGSTNDELICLTSLLATSAEMTGQTLPDNAGEDSDSILPALLGTGAEPSHKAVVHHTHRGKFALRQGKWKLCLFPGSGGWGRLTDKKARGQGLPEIQLYDMEKDVGETTNLAAQHPEKVEQLVALLKKLVADGRSTPGVLQKNDAEIDIFKTDK